jgi:hypothetical protein
VSHLSYSSLASYRGNTGTLKIERGKLVFTAQAGLMNRREYVLQTIPISAVRSVHIDGKVRPVLVVIVDTSVMSGIPRHEFLVDAPGVWVDVIESEMQNVSVQGTQQQQPTYVKEIVREVVKYPCPYCNALIEVTSSRCPFCGAPQKK